MAYIQLRAAPTRTHSRHYYDLHASTVNGNENEQKLILQALTARLLFP